jgi:hypothetical protein
MFVGHRDRQNRTKSTWRQQFWRSLPAAPLGVSSPCRHRHWTTRPQPAMLPPAPTDARLSPAVDQFSGQDTGGITGRDSDLAAKLSRIREPHVAPLNDLADEIAETRGIPRQAVNSRTGGARTRDLRFSDWLFAVVVDRSRKCLSEKRLHCTLSTLGSSQFSVILGHKRRIKDERIASPPDRCAHQVLSGATPPSAGKCRFARGAVAVKARPGADRPAARP